MEKGQVSGLHIVFIDSIYIISSFLSLAQGLVFELIKRC